MSLEREINRKRAAWKNQASKELKWLRLTMWISIGNMILSIVSLVTPSKNLSELSLIILLIICGMAFVGWRMDKTQGRLYKELMEAYSSELNRH